MGEAEPTKKDLCVSLSRSDSSEGLIDYYLEWHPTCRIRCLEGAGVTETSRCLDCSETNTRFQMDRREGSSS